MDKIGIYRRKVTEIEDIESLYQPRSSADLAVRRLRLKDIWPYLDRSQKNFILTLSHLDLMLVTNISVWIICFGVNKAKDLAKRGFFNSLLDFVDRSTKLSSEIKRYDGSLDDTKQATCELNSLTGYLQNDIEPTDWKAKVKELATGGNEHGYEGMNWEKAFSDSLSSVCPKRATPRFLTFPEFIESGVWLTPGSSSIGHIEWSWGDKRGRFKARKNMLEQIYTTEELIEIVDEWSGRLESKAFTKDELSKRRIAVASNIESYLVESYILHNLGHMYKKWQYITLDENAKQNHERTSDVVLLLQQGKWALPFDFKNFDHQPNMQEILKMINYNQALITPTKGYEMEWKYYCNQMLKSYKNNTITFNKDGVSVSERMTGGLPSGVRWTSLLGNQWNAVVSNIARQLTTRMLGYDPVLRLGVRGDDTYILADKAGELLLFRLAYGALNTIGLDSKFGISRNVCEFLRNEISVNGCRGWSNRSIPSITQRKPWNAGEITPGNDVITVADNIYTLSRRLQKDVSVLHSANKNKWSRYTNQDPRWLHLPRHLGGFGIYEFEGWIPDRPYYKFEPQKFHIEKLVPAEQYAWIELSSSELLQISQHRINNTINSDDIPKTRGINTREYLKNLRHKKYSWTKASLRTSIKNCVRCEPPRIDRKVYWPKDTHYEYNTYKGLSVTEFIHQYREVSNVKEVPSLITYLREFYPPFAVRIAGFEKNGWHRSDAVDLALGKIPTEPTRLVHPILTPFISDVVKKNGVYFWKGRKNIAYRLNQLTSSCIKSMSTNPNNAMYYY